MHPPKLLGKVAYITTYPLILTWLRGSRRVYVAFVVDDEILVTKNWLGLHQKWRLPGGGVRKNEPLLIGLQREVEEELAICIPESKLQLLGAKSYSAKAGYVYTVYLAKYAQKPDLNPNTNELVATEWLPIADVAKQQISLELHTALELLTAC